MNASSGEYGLAPWQWPEYAVCLASAVRAASTRNCEILRSWYVMSIVGMLPAPRINDMLHRVTFAAVWESPRSQVLGRLVSVSRRGAVLRSAARWGSYVSDSTHRAGKREEQNKLKNTLRKMACRTVAALWDVSALLLRTSHPMNASTIYSTPDMARPNRDTL
jgi:hypothetical protein